MNVSRNSSIHPCSVTGSSLCSRSFPVDSIFPVLLCMALISKVLLSYFIQYFSKPSFSTGIITEQHWWGSPTDALTEVQICCDAFTYWSTSEKCVNLNLRVLFTGSSSGCTVLLLQEGTACDTSPSDTHKCNFYSVPLPETVSGQVSAYMGRFQVWVLLNLACMDHLLKLPVALQSLAGLTAS